MGTVDVPIPACDIRQGDHIVPNDGTVRVVVATVESVTTMLTRTGA